MIEDRPQLVLALPRGGDSYEVLFIGNEGNKHWEVFHANATNPKYEAVRIYEHLLARMVVHPAPAPVAEPTPPPPAAEVKQPAPETALKPKPPPPPHHETHSKAKGYK